MCYHNRSETEENRIQLSSVKLDIKDICKNVKWLHYSYDFFLLWKIQFLKNKNVIIFTCNRFILLFLYDLINIPYMYQF